MEQNIASFDNSVTVTIIPHKMEEQCDKKWFELQTQTWL